MANHKSADKAYQQSKVRQARNNATLSRIKSYMKRIEKMVEEGRADDARLEFNSTQSEIHKGVTKGILKKNTAARRISKLAKSIKSAALADKPAKPVAKAASKPATKSAKKAS